MDWETAAITPGSKPRHKELATGTELEHGWRKFISVKSLSMIQSFRKGLMVALVVELDILHSPPNLDEIWSMKKSELANLLWDDVVRYYFPFGTGHLLWLIFELFVAPKECPTGTRAGSLPSAVCVNTSTAMPLQFLHNLPTCALPGDTEQNKAWLFMDSLTLALPMITDNSNIGFLDPHFNIAQWACTG